MKRVITINSNDLEKSLYTKELLTKKLEENNFLVSSKLEENTELIISIGGDGSFLKTIQDFKFPNVPMVVINTGHLGFFAEFDPDEIDEFIELYKNNNFTIQEVHPLKASFCINPIDAGIVIDVNLVQFWKAKLWILILVPAVGNTILISGMSVK